MVSNRLLIKQQLVQDLQWIMHSPGLLNEDDPQVLANKELSELFQSLDLNKIDVSPLQEKTSRPYVGDYFENLIALLLRQHPDIENVKQRIPVRDATHTIGEFDFLFSDRTENKTKHWEVAFKYYLQPRSSERGTFLGPNAKDTLNRKVTRLFQHQAKLAQNPEAVNILSDYPQPVHAQILLKGFLFYHASQNWRNINKLPSYIAKSHLRGWWCHAGESCIPQTDSASRWKIMSKPYWLTVDQRMHDSKNLLNHNELETIIKASFKDSDRPLLLAELVQTGNEQFQELSRGFVVSNDWPTRN